MTVSTEQTWHEMHHQLRSFFRRRVGDAQLAEDLLQDTFLRIHQGLVSLADDERVGPWVYRIARNTWVDYLRKGASTREIPTADLTQIAEPFEEANQEEVAGWLGQMVQRLPAKYQAAARQARGYDLVAQVCSASWGLSGHAVPFWLLL